MAAPGGGGGGSAVSVLAPNGRRHTVKVTPSTVLLQVSEDCAGPLSAVEVCQPAQERQAGDGACLPGSRGAREQGRWLWAGLSQRLHRALGPWDVDQVRIALQLDDGSRLQDTFCSGQTLWELLSHFAQTRECLEQLREGAPACVYMRDEVTGQAALQRTTLQSLGVTGGSAIIRFVVKPCNAAGRQEPAGPGSRAPGSPVPSVSANQTPGHAQLPLSSGGLSGGDLSPQPDAGPVETSCADGLSPKSADTVAEPGTAGATPAPFVPFSGGGQRLGGPSQPVRSLVSPSAKLLTSPSPGGPSKPKKSKPGQEAQQAAEPALLPTQRSCPGPAHVSVYTCQGRRPTQSPADEEATSGRNVDVPGLSLPQCEPEDRAPAVFHPDHEEPLRVWPTELPAEFFEVTVDDVRRRLAQLQSERRRLEEAPLVTKAFREAQVKQRLERYPKVVLRVLFPDRHVLQGFFCPSETVGDLQDFVRSHLGDAELPFHLFIAPPKTVLSDSTQTLFQASLFPAALVHFGTEEPTGPYLEPRLLERAISPSSANALVAKSMSWTAAPLPSLPAPDPAPLESEPAAEGARDSPEPGPPMAQPVRRSLSKVPKWLKLPASKR
ncbi:tether containing UBX domain for GLUT4 isoform X1 [Choloepus didactylus]|uniref:tether containing UBX domain for GLUT4 isoform X1 n=1 Tax=Choloepus didactylus TaxID=27675 RepID=UPI0018A03CC4|nr:tether containing UBX domain for GLUT4 isoform X1 [Choloepus didactylus]